MSFCHLHHMSTPCVPAGKHDEMLYVLGMHVQCSVCGAMGPPVVAGRALSEGRGAEAGTCWGHDGCARWGHGGCLHGAAGAQHGIPCLIVCHSASCLALFIQDGCMHNHNPYCIQCRRLVWLCSYKMDACITITPTAYNVGVLFGSVHTRWMHA